MTEQWVRTISFVVLVIWLAVMAVIAVRSLPASPRKKGLQIAMTTWAASCAALVLVLQYLGK